MIGAYDFRGWKMERRTEIITDLSVNVHAASVALLSKSIRGSLHLADAIQTVVRVIDVYVHRFEILFVVIIRVRSLIHDEGHGRLRTRRVGSLLLVLATLSRCRLGDARHVAIFCDDLLQSFGYVSVIARRQLRRAREFRERLKRIETFLPLLTDYAVPKLWIFPLARFLEKRKNALRFGIIVRVRCSNRRRRRRRRRRPGVP